MKLYPSFRMGKIIFSVLEGRRIVPGKCNCPSLSLRDGLMYSPSTIFRPQAVRVSGSCSAAENQGEGSGEGACPRPRKKYNSNYRNVSFLALGTENSVCSISLLQICVEMSGIFFCVQSGKCVMNVILYFIRNVQVSCVTI